MEDELYNLTVKGNDLKTYIRRFQELAVSSLMPETWYKNTEKTLEDFIGGLPRSIEGNVTASKPQTLEEAITITQSSKLIKEVNKVPKNRSEAKKPREEALQGRAKCDILLNYLCEALISKLVDDKD
ncbi:hypothetical protein Tco_1060618 [Tanacetum coccineum]